MSKKSKIKLILRYKIVAIVLTIATIIVSCKTGKKIEDIDLTQLPSQVAYGINAIRTSNGDLSMRVIAPKMERYDNVDSPYEKFPDGFQLLGYNADGLLETKIEADIAIHMTDNKEEMWEAYGNVVITNFIKGEVMKTDTLYWDKSKSLIYTNCFVTLSSPDGFMQGHGMKSDEMARNAEILKPFDSYGIIQNDSIARQYIDTVNFVGPIIK